MDISDLSVNSAVEKVIEVFKALALLSTIGVFHGNFFSIDDANFFKTELKQLQEFKFIKNDTDDATDLEQRLSNGHTRRMEL